MSQRERVNRRLGSDQLRPQAAPARAPQLPNVGQGQSKAGQLADALATVSPALERYGDARFRQVSAEDYAAGSQVQRLEEERVRLGEDKRTSDELVAAGVISADRTPYFEAGLREQMGRSAAGAYGAAMEAAWAETLQHSNDPEDFARVEAEVRADVIAESLGETDRDLFFEGAFGRAADGIMAGQHQRFEAHVSKNRMDLMIQGVGTFVVDALRNTDPESQLAEVQAYMDERIKVLNIPPEMINAAVADAVVAYAVATRDRTLVDFQNPDALINRLQAGHTALSSRPAIMDQLREAENQIANLVGLDDNRASKDREEASRELLNDGISRIIESGDQAELDDLIVQLHDMGGEGSQTAALLSSARGQILGARPTTPEAVIRSFVDGIWSGSTGNRDILRALSDGRIDLASFNYLQGKYMEYDNFQENQRRRAMGDGGKAQGELEMELLNDGFYTQFRSRFRQEFASLDGVFSGPDSGKATQAEGELNTRWIAWRMGAGADASPAEVDSWLQSEAGYLLNSPQYKPTGGTARPNLGAWRGAGTAIIATPLAQPVIGEREFYQVLETLETGFLSTELRDNTLRRLNIREEGTRADLELLIDRHRHFYMNPTEAPIP